jgi:hypothetical protein
VGYRKTTVLFAALLFVFFSLQTNAQVSREYSIKAAFLYNFTQFVEWPSAAYNSPEAPFIIGIIGNDPFRTAIDDAIAGEKVKGHPIVIQRYQNIKDLKLCHILFVSNKEVGRWKEIKALLPNKNTLTVSDIPDFATNGGIIRLLTKENKVKLQINLAASKEADLDISSKLLQLAEIVR